MTELSRYVWCLKMHVSEERAHLAWHGRFTVCRGRPGFDEILFNYVRFSMRIVWNCGSLMKAPYFCDSVSLKLLIIRLHNRLHNRYCRRRAPRHGLSQRRGKTQLKQLQFQGLSCLSSCCYIFTFFSFSLKIWGQHLASAFSYRCWGCKSWNLIQRNCRY